MWRRDPACCYTEALLSHTETRLDVAQITGLIWHRDLFQYATACRLDVAQRPSSMRYKNAARCGTATGLDVTQRAGSMRRCMPGFHSKNDQILGGLILTIATPRENYCWPQICTTMSRVLVPHRMHAHLHPLTHAHRYVCEHASISGTSRRWHLRM